MSVSPAPSARPAEADWQQSFQNWMLRIILIAVVVVPLLASPSNPAMQRFAILALYLVAALSAGILALGARVATRREEVVTFLATGPNLAVLLFGMVSLLSLLLNLGDTAAYRRLQGAEMMRISVGILLYFAVAYHIRRKEHIAKVRDALTLVAALMAFLGLLSLGLQENNRQAALFGDHQLFGAFLMILFPVPLLSALTERDTKKQLAAQIAAALTGICLIMSGTRTAWLGTLFMAVALLFLSRIGRSRRPSGFSGWKQYVIPALIILTCGAMLFLMSYGQTAQLIQQRLDRETGQISLEGRQRTWYAAQQLVILKPVFGHGPGSFPVLQQPYSQFGRMRNAVLGSGAALSEMAHNFWLQMAAEQGLMGLAAFAGIILTFLTAGARRLRQSELGSRRWLLMSCLAGIIGFCVDAIGNPAWHYAQISLFFWLILGLGTACMRPQPMRR